jgi:hypothetical protein
LSLEDLTLLGRDLMTKLGAQKMSYNASKQLYNYIHLYLTYLCVVVPVRFSALEEVFMSYHMEHGGPWKC